MEQVCWVELMGRSDAESLPAGGSEAGRPGRASHLLSAHGPTHPSAGVFCSPRGPRSLGVSAWCPVNQVVVVEEASFERGRASWRGCPPRASGPQGIACSGTRRGARLGQRAQLGLWEGWRGL